MMFSEAGGHGESMVSITVDAERREAMSAAPGVVEVVGSEEQGRGLGRKGEGRRAEVGWSSGDSVHLPGVLSAAGRGIVAKTHLTLP